MLLTISLAPSALADSKSKLDKISYWVDHFTFGLPTTLVGGAVFGGQVAKKAIQGDKIKVRRDKTRRQLVLEDTSGTPNAIGPFHFGLLDSLKMYSPISPDDLDLHESGHGIQTGMFGPSFALLVVPSYLYGANKNPFDPNVGHEAQPNENWAAAWSRYYYDSLVNASALDLKLGYGQQQRFLNFKYSLLERSSRLETFGADAHENERHRLYRNSDYPFFHEDDYDATSEAPVFPVEVSSKYAAIGATLAQNCDSEKTIVSLEATLFERRFLTEWKLVLPALRLLSDSEQILGDFEINIDNGAVNTNLISHKAGYGFRAGHRDEIAIDVIGRVGYGIKGKWESEEGSPGVIGLVSTGYEGKVHARDLVNIYYRVDNEYGTSNYRLRRETAGISTPRVFRYKVFTGKAGKSGKPVPLYGSIEAVHERETYDQKLTQQGTRTLIFNIGGRW